MTAISQEMIELIVGSTEVSKAKARVDALTTGSILFTIPLSDSIKAALQAAMGLDLTDVTHVPMRWIKGDTLPHIDKGAHDFANTYLIYLTNSPGALIIGENEYAITQGSVFVFNEGIYHETRDTGAAPRLMIGPMSEAALPVGAGTFIQGDGGTSAYIRDNSGTLEWSLDQSNWNTLYFPCFVQNTNTSVGIFKIIFLTDIQLNNTYEYFITYSDKIQYGSESLSDTGLPRYITVTADNYEGVIENGSFGVNGHNDISVYNLYVNGDGHTTQIGGAWIGKQYFGLGAARNYFINCSSAGDINGGGIAGDYSENVTCIGCSSAGSISDNAGGIVGQFVSSILIQSCWSTGIISGNGAGGIAGSNSTGVTVSNSYSEGVVSGPNSGGIVGSNAGSCSITKCYSRGNITGPNAGGICGSLAPASGLLTVTITNCYSTGNLNNGGVNVNGAICGLLVPYGSGSVNVLITNCYTTGTVVLAKGYIIGNVVNINGINSLYTLTGNFSEAGSSGGSPGNWSDNHAQSILQGAPSSSPDVGVTWVSIAANTAYEIANMGYTPYQTQVISDNALVQSVSQTVTAGGTSTLALAKDASGNSFAILKITGGDSGSYALFTISTQTGGISVPAAVIPGTYTIYVRSIGSYNITRAIITIQENTDEPATSEAIACCSIPLELSNQIDYSMRLSVTTGNIILVNGGGRSKQLSSSDLLKIKKAKAAKR